jgi:hypothetical protein
VPRSNQTSTSDPRRHRRDPDKHRQEILAAAGAAFTERGYQRATLRDIASRAGVTHGSVLRHFGSKEELFLAAMPGPRDLADVAEGPLDTLAERITAAYLGRMQKAGNSDPFVALLRSAGGDDSAATGLLLAMQQSSEEVYRRLLGPHSLVSTVPFLASLLIGVTFTRYVARRGTLADMSVEQCQHYLQAAVQALIDAAALSSPCAPGR